jgi:uncharacterized membrane protein
MKQGYGERGILASRLVGLAYMFYSIKGDNLLWGKISLELMRLVMSLVSLALMVRMFRWSKMQRDCQTTFRSKPLPSYRWLERQKIFLPRCCISKIR